MRAEPPSMLRRQSCRSIRIRPGTTLDRSSSTPPPHSPRGRGPCHPRHPLVVLADRRREPSCGIAARADGGWCLHLRHRAGQGRDRWHRPRAEGAPPGSGHLPSGRHATEPADPQHPRHGGRTDHDPQQRRRDTDHRLGPGRWRHPHPGEHVHQDQRGGRRGALRRLVPCRRPALRARHRRRPEGDQGRHREGRRGRWLRVRSRRGGPYLADDQDPRDHDPPHPGPDRQGHPRARQPRRGDPRRGHLHRQRAAQPAVREARQGGERRDRPQPRGAQRLRRHQAQGRPRLGGHP